MANDAQIQQVKDAIAAGKSPEGAVRINFGDAEPIQTVSSAGTDPISLTGKTKAQLEQIAVDEGVDISGASTNADIVAAIETARSGA